MIDLFIPTCDRDREQIPLLLRSLDTYMERDAVRSLNLAVVDTAACLSQMRGLNTHKFAERTRVWALWELGLGEHNGTYDRGWSLQQAAKLVFARQSQSPFFMVLDSKNLALRPIDLSDLIVDGRAAQTHEPLKIHAKWWRGSCWALDHRRFDRAPARMVLSSATPVLFHTASVVAMLDWLERRHGESVERFFLRRRPIRDRFMQPTEFTLYHVYMDRERLLDRYHFVSTTLQDRVTQIWASQTHEVRTERLERMASGQIGGLFTGIARPAWQALQAPERDQLRRMVAGEPMNAASAVAEERAARG